MTTDMFPFEERTIGELVKLDSPWEQKVWGSVQHVFNSPDVAVSVLKVNAGFRCSRHLHRHRCNQFILVYGHIEIWSWEEEDSVIIFPNRPYKIDHLIMDEMKETGPRSAGIVDIESGVPHMFVVRESGLVVEIYTPDGGPVDIDDIVRFDEGGPV